MLGGHLMKFMAMMASSLVAVGFRAEARELAGVKLDETVNVQGKELKLNGAGIRKKVVFKVYVGGLYLEAPSKDGAALLASDQILRVKEVWLRSVSKGKITDTYDEEFKHNAGADYDKLKDRIEKFTAAITDVNEGDEVLLTYVPGKGTTMTIKGTDVVTIEGKDFRQLLFGLWLGPSPGDKGLAEAMLGK
jgi:Chalcone isomerase-like